MTAPATPPWATAPAELSADRGAAGGPGRGPLVRMNKKIY